MKTEKIQIDLPKIKDAFDERPRKKKELARALNMDRQAIWKMLNGKRGMTGAELLTIAKVLQEDPFELAL